MITCAEQAALYYGRKRRRQRATTEAQTTGDEPTLGIYETRLTTEGAGAEVYGIDDIQGFNDPRYKKIRLVALGAGGDTVSVDTTNLRYVGAEPTSVIIDAVGEYVELEWRGLAWEIIGSSSGVVTP